jgi:hypothetical protein
MLRIFCIPSLEEKNMKLHHCHPTIILLVFMIFQVGCGSYQLNSQWLDREITIDGNADEWLGAKYYFEEDQVAVGFFNDETYLYMGLMAENPMLLGQIMRQGLTLWIDPMGKKNKYFGIRFPIAGPDRQGNPPTEEMGELNRVELQNRIAQSLKELEIIGPGENQAERLPLSGITGMEIAVNPSAGTLVYELKIPLAADDNNIYAVGAVPGDKISIGMLSPKLDFQASSRRRPGGMSGTRGIGGRRPGGMAGGRLPGRPGGFRMPKDLKIWASLQLALK